MDDLLNCAEGDLTDEQVAGVALALADQITKATAALETLKVRLRAVASCNVAGGKTVTLKGEDLDGKPVGDVTVTFPRAQAALAKGFNPAAVRAALGEEVFNLYFETKIVLNKHALETLRERREDPSLSEEEFTAMFSAVDITEPTPRVGFQPIPQSLLNARYG